MKVSWTFRNFKRYLNLNTHKLKQTLSGLFMIHSHSEHMWNSASGVVPMETAWRSICYRYQEILNKTEILDSWVTEVWKHEPAPKRIFPTGLQRHQAVKFMYLWTVSASTVGGLVLFSSESNSSSALKHIPRLLWNTKIHSHVPEYQPLTPVLIYINTTHTFLPSVNIQLILSSHLLLCLQSGFLLHVFPHAAPN